MSVILHMSPPRHESFFAALLSAVSKMFSSRVQDEFRLTCIQPHKREVLVRNKSRNVCFILTLDEAEFNRLFGTRNRCYVEGDYDYRNPRLTFKLGDTLERNW